MTLEVYTASGDVAHRTALDRVSRAGAAVSSTCDDSLAESPTGRGSLMMRTKITLVALATAGVSVGSAAWAVQPRLLGRRRIGRSAPILADLGRGDGPQAGVDDAEPLHALVGEPPRARSFGLC